MTRLPYYLSPYPAQKPMQATAGGRLFVGLACLYGGIALTVLALAQ